MPPYGRYFCCLNATLYELLQFGERRASALASKRDAIPGVLFLGTALGTARPLPHVRLEQSGGTELRINVLCASTQVLRERDRCPEQDGARTKGNRVWESRC